MSAFDEQLAVARELRAQGARGRYAPSPTGPLHLGNVRTALISWLQARLVGGTYIMRNEDLDENRALEGCDEQIYEDLRWLGLDWDEGPDVGGPVGPYDQSERTHFYLDALLRLEEAGRVFRCYCSRKDVREAASAPHGSSGVIYPGTCRELSPEEAEEARQRHPGRTPSWRYRVPPGQTSLEDIVSGPYSQELDRDVGDFVVRRADELYAYQLAVVVDDALMGVTDVVRGDDLLPSTPRQIELFRALELPVPEFWHIPLMYDEEGNRMSKRERSASLARLRDEQDARPEAIVGQLAASLGLVEPGAELSAQELLEDTTIDALTDALRQASTETPSSDS
ncbi:MAG: tRNA glutamyl-Q(34) synthetase GluQRS [Myxococcota bacterium]